MDSQHRAVVGGLLALTAGLLMGYFFGMNAAPYRGTLGEGSMYGEMAEERGGYGHALMDDGELQHMMDEMLLIGRGKTGAAYEEAWLRGMIVHHLGAIRMSETLLTHTERPELEAFASGIIESQSAEVEQMEDWLEVWFTEN